MHHLILGYGYCGYYLAQELLKNKQNVTALSRHLNHEMALPGLNHLTIDLNQPFKWTDPDTILYYLIPPPAQGDHDVFLKQFLGHSLIKARKVLYFGSSGVYGDHQGAWVNEESPCLINHSRQRRRLDAEQQWLSFCTHQKIDAVLLRIAGIYGPNRLPIDEVKAKTPVMELDKAPYTNHIFVKDLAKIASLLGQSKVSQSLYNIADGHPTPMGSLQQLVAQYLGVEEAPYESWEQIWERASPMKREFMKGSKRLDIKRLRTTLGSSYELTTLNDGVYQSLQDHIVS
ncbi:SDR family oxidoreductase [Legionella bononiensis]|uniref:SDR family oxidoreductase n=1 Tax=Legionella bononiensis TaxID=2793102 RepID=A0ABS1WAP2_9GAMM|nr:SDR family oxidoreductase [Legionella bononiensis]MBL7480431.1 SDR family oxidoreductase [Legionella bononiensis]MBL7526335.1 SDR family oxidoreductase [Legionella bononiensis]MBL7563171.1 SDR family oxidoreductase [Legionella bononiensis]